MNQSQWSRHSSGQQGPVYSQALAHPPPLVLVSTTCLYTESAYHAQESMGGPGGVWWGHCTGTRFLIQVLLFSIMWPWAFPFPSWSLRFLICQSGPDGEAPPRLGIVIPLTSVRVLCLHSTFAFFLGREACVYTLPQSRASHRQACRGAVVLLGGREGAHVSCAPLLCSKPLATITSFHPGRCPLWQLVLLSSFHRRGN